MTEESKAVVNWADKLAEHAVAAAAVQRPTQENISVRGGYMKLNGVEVPNSELDTVVVASVFENQYYDPTKPFDPDNLQNPICFAQSLTGEDMVPDPASTDVQSETCESCQWMKWKSDPVRKKGKACKEKQKLAIIPATQLKDAGIQKAAMAVLSLPVTSTSNWANYVNAIRDQYQRPPFAVLTRVRSRPHPRYQLEVTFECMGIVADEFLGDVLARVEPAQRLMMQPYEGTPDDPTKATSENKKKAKY